MIPFFKIDEKIESASDIALKKASEQFKKIDEITEYAGYFGIAPEDVVMLLEYGYDELEIEEMLYDPLEMQKCISAIKLCEMLC